VDEHVSTPTIDGDEAEALVSVEPLHGSLSHVYLLLKTGGRARRPADWPFLSSGA
jgi:hypothetical protein